MNSYSEYIRLMGNHFIFTACHEDEMYCKKSISAGIEEVRRIESLLSTYIDDSFTSLINRHAGIRPVEVPLEMLQLIQRSKKISELTDGAFDISYGGIDADFFNFNQSMQTLPDPTKALSATRLVNFQNIILDADNHTVYLKEKGMRIGFGGIGKGYAADQAKKVMVDHGILHGVVNASGDLTAWGYQANGKPWTIGIANPDLKNHMIGKFEIHNGSAATSGDYEKYVTIGGKRYSHTINPRTGMPAEGLKSVTVISPLAEICDALTTPVIIMGAAAGLHLINQIKHVEAVVIDNKNTVYFSNNINIS